MASLRNGKVLRPTSTSDNANSKETRHEPSHKPTSNTGKKRKALEAEEETENTSTNRPSTPTPAVRKSEPADNPDYEKTPGRDGPIKSEKNCPEPDIKPFKGPPGKKVRKTHWEKEEEYKQFALENEGHTFHELHVCHKKGPQGSPTYDKAGFQLDWDKVDEWMQPQPYNKSRMVKGMDKAVEKSRNDEARMKELFFEKGEAPQDESLLHYCAKDAWMDRVSKDLNIPWHKIEIKDFELWDKKGFKKARKGEYEEFSKKETDRLSRLLSGASLRK